MPKAGETPEMGSNPLLGFGRVYARPQVARFVDHRIHRLLNDPATGGTTSGATCRRRASPCGARRSTRSRTPPASPRDRATGPMTVLHLFDQPLKVAQPYEGYIGHPGAARAGGRAGRGAFDPDRLPDPAQPGDGGDPGRLPGHRAGATSTSGPSAARPASTRIGIAVAGVARARRPPRRGRLERARHRHGGLHRVGHLRAHLPGRHLPRRRDGAPHLFICDGYAASAEAMQAASLDPVLGLQTSMALFSSRFEVSWEREAVVMRLDPDVAGLRRPARPHPSTRSSTPADRRSLPGEHAPGARRPSCRSASGP